MAEDCTYFNRTNCVRSRTRLLPSGRHPRVASLAPSGQFTFSCQPPALRNRGLTDVGHRRRRQRYPFPCCVDLGRNENILDIFRAHRAVWGTPRERCPYEGIFHLHRRSTPIGRKISTNSQFLVDMLYPVRNLCVIFCYFLFYFLFFLCYKRGESKTHRKAPLLGFASKPTDP